MAYDTDNKSSAELQRELEQQRNRVEDTIDELQKKLSPGQLVDELLAYTKGGGSEFVASLQKNVTANPLPVALLGVSLAWLIAKPAPSRDDAAWDNSINKSRGYGRSSSDAYDDTDYPVATISGSSLQRVGHIDENGRRFSEFTDDAGKKFRASSDEHGNRAGHFADEAGNRFKGFVDATGSRVEQFRDETGNLLEEASGWASHTWQMAREKMHDARDAMSSAGQSGRSHMGDLSQTLLHQFSNQPLVGGALAFAFGAALGAALPHTAQEDAVLGEASDQLKQKAGAEASALYEQGREKATQLHETALQKGGDLYRQAKDGMNQSESSA